MKSPIIIHFKIALGVPSTINNKLITYEAVHAKKVNLKKKIKFIHNCIIND